MSEPSPALLSPDFEALLSDIAHNPRSEPLLNLLPATFAEFVGYLFTCAGYEAVSVENQFYPNGVGVDFNLFADLLHTDLLARVEVRRYKPDNPLSADAVFAFQGKLGGKHAGGVLGFLVTTGTFTGPAYHAEREHPGLATLIDGAHLLRYITYVHGSRIPQADGRYRLPRPLPPTWFRMADLIQRPLHTKTKVLAVGNNRGGVGKTVTALELGIGLAKRGKRVVVVDLDGQGSLTLALPPPTPAPAKKSGKKSGDEVLPESSQALSTGDISQYFASSSLPDNERIALASLVGATVFPHLWLIASGKLIQDASSVRVRSSLHAMDTGGSAHPEDEVAFVSAIADLSRHGAPDGTPYDWILLDTPPAQSRYTRAALAAAHEVLLCTGVEAFAAQGANGLLDTADAMRALMGSGTELIGALITRFPASPKSTLQDEKLKLINQLAKQGVPVIGEIPPDDKVDLTNRNAVQGGVFDKVKGLFGFATSSAAIAYGNLIGHLLQEAPHDDS